MRRIVVLQISAWGTGPTYLPFCRVSGNCETSASCRNQAHNLHTGAGMIGFRRGLRGVLLIEGIQGMGSALTCKGARIDQGTLNLRVRIL